MNELLKEQYDFRELITHAEESMRNHPDSFGMNDKRCPLKHSYGDGLYIREIFMPKGALIISKLHKKTHPYFIISGKVSVATEDGTIMLEAPYHGMRQAGTKRALVIHEDTVWVTVHATDKTDLKEIEEEIISKNYEDFDLIPQDIKEVE